MTVGGSAVPASSSTAPAGNMAFNKLVRLLFGLTTRDTQSGLKGFSRGAAAQIFQQLYTDGFLFDIEIFVRSRALGIPVAEVPVQLTFEDDVTTVQQFTYLFKVIPELARIKMLEMRGAYANARGGVTPSSLPESVSPKHFHGTSSLRGTSVRVRRRHRGQHRLTLARGSRE